MATPTTRITPTSTISSAGHEHDATRRSSGYTETGQARVTILENMLSENDRVADDNGLDSPLPASVR